MITYETIWPNLGLTKEEISNRVSELSNEGKTTEEMLVILLSENNAKATQQLRQSMQFNLDSIASKIKD